MSIFALLLRHWRLIGMLALVAAVVLGLRSLYTSGYDAGAAAVQAKWDAEDKARNEAAQVMAAHAARRANEAAERYRSDVSALKDEIWKLKADNAKTPPSPVGPDCRLSDERLRKLEAAIHLANTAANRQRGSGQVPGADKAESRRP